MRHLRSRLSQGVMACLLFACLCVPAITEAQEEKGTTSYGNVSYQLYCRSCHGDTGKGDGSAAEILKVPPPDLTLISHRNGGEFPTEEVYRTIDGRGMLQAHGRDMPFWGEAFKVTEETDDEKVVVEKIQALVRYLESIQVKE